MPYKTKNHKGLHPMQNFMVLFTQISNIKSLQLSLQSVLVTDTIILSNFNMSVNLFFLRSFFIMTNYNTNRNQCQGNNPLTQRNLTRLFEQDCRKDDAKYRCHKTKYSDL